MKSEDYGKELWSLANYITGFFIAQYLAAALALNDALDNLAKKPPPFKITISLIAVAVAGLYCLGVHSCRTLASSLDDTREHDYIWARINRWRLGCIVLFTAIFVFALFEHDIPFLHPAAVPVAKP